MTDRGFMHDVHIIQEDGDDAVLVEVYRCEEEDGMVEGLGPCIASTDARTLPGFEDHYGDDPHGEDTWHFYETDSDLPDFIAKWVGEQIEFSYGTITFHDHAARWLGW